MSAKLTPWFPGNVNPVRVGVYQQMCGFNETVGYQYWDGLKWRLRADCAEHAYLFRNSSIDIKFQSNPWRGLAEPPK